LPIAKKRSFFYYYERQNWVLYRFFGAIWVLIAARRFKYVKGKIYLKNPIGAHIYADKCKKK